MLIVSRDVIRALSQIRVISDGIGTITRRTDLARSDRVKVAPRNCPTAWPRMFPNRYLNVRPLIRAVWSVSEGDSPNCWRYC
jgi:hypothetical protein